MNKVETTNIASIGKIIISNRLKRKIDYLHNMVGKFEWSGVLFYKLISGNISEMRDVVFEAVDLYPLDIGSTAFTTFEYKPEDVVEMYDAIEDAMEMSMGLIHTHHSMNAFFSGTDFDEITGNSSNYNYYISLVVSFDEKYACKIAFPTTQKYTREFSIRDDSGELKNSVVTSEGQTIILSDLKIEFEYEQELEGWFIDKHLDLVEANKRKIVTSYKTTNKMDYGYNYGYNRNYNYGNGYGSDDDIDYNDWRNWQKPTRTSGVNNTPGVRTRYVDPEVDAVSSFEQVFPQTEVVENELELTSLDKFLYLIVADTFGKPTPNNDYADEGYIEYDFHPKELLEEMDDWRQEDFMYFEQVLDADIIFAFEEIYTDEMTNPPMLVKRLKEVIDYVPQLHDSRNTKKFVGMLKKFVKAYDQV